MNPEHRSGRVFIVGAGPGDPGLMTVKGLDKLRRADVVVYDRLISDELLSYCSGTCEKVFVGKESGFHPIEQVEIIEILIRKARQGLTVVRLKGGNPFVFGRGSEEAIALKEAGVDFEIIPGITSGLSAPIYSGIPVTHRGLITQCVLITAHESPEKEGTQVDWDKLAKLKNTSLIIYMGASRIESISRELVKYGMDPSTPSAVIENGTLPRQRTITGRLDEIALEFKAHDFHAPAIIMISAAVAIREQISWYEDRPLFGKRVVLAGPDRMLQEIKELVFDLGGEVISLPFSDPDAIPDYHGRNEVEAVDILYRDTHPVSEGAKNLSSNYQGLFTKSTSPVFAAVSSDTTSDCLERIRDEGADVFVFATSSAVEYLFDSLGYDEARLALESGHVIAIDPKTADTLNERHACRIIATSGPDTGAVRELLLSMFPKARR